MKTLLILSAMLSLAVSKAQTLTESELLNYINLNNAVLNSNGVLQLGNGNYAEILGSSVSVVQQGNGQQFFYTESAAQPGQMSIQIEGNNTSVEVVGNNGILDYATIRIEGDNRDVLIINNP